MRWDYCQCSYHTYSFLNISSITDRIVVIVTFKWPIKNIQHDKPSSLQSPGWTYINIKGKYNQQYTISKKAKNTDPWTDDKRESDPSCKYDVDHRYYHGSNKAPTKKKNTKNTKQKFQKMWQIGDGQ